MRYGRTLVPNDRLNPGAPPSILSLLLIMGRCQEGWPHRTADVRMGFFDARRGRGQRIQSDEPIEEHNNYLFPSGRRGPRSGPNMLLSLSIIDLYFFGLKTIFLYMLIYSFVKFENLQKHWLFLSLLYSAGVAFLSFVFLIAPGRLTVYWGTMNDWWIWVAKTLVFAAIYFKLLARFDEGVLFWLLLIGGVFLVRF